MTETHIFVLGKFELRFQLRSNYYESEVSLLADDKEIGTMGADDFWDLANDITGTDHRRWSQSIDDYEGLDLNDVEQYLKNDLDIDRLKSLLLVYRYFEPAMVIEDPPLEVRRTKVFDCKNKEEKRSGLLGLLDFMLPPKEVEVMGQGWLYFVDSDIYTNDQLDELVEAGALEKMIYQRDWEKERELWFTPLVDDSFSSPSLEDGRAYRTLQHILNEMDLEIYKNIVKQKNEMIRLLR